jgi:hypothetical protein
MDTTNAKDRSDEQHRTGKTLRAIEHTAASIPSSTFFMLAGGAVVGSIALKAMGRSEAANFVGEWVPTILMLGLYNKISKLFSGQHGELGRT